MPLFNRLLSLLGYRSDLPSPAYHLNPELDALIADLAQQEHCTPEEIVEQLINQALQQRQTAADLWQRWQSLSIREQQVAALICLGYTNSEIASQLGITIDTIKSHIRNIFGKFSINNRKELQLLLVSWNFQDWIPPTSGG